jgi:hypothetical protein
MGEPAVLAEVISVRGHRIRLTLRQWLHISENHDYMAGNRTLDVHFVYTLPVPGALRHSRESGNPEDERYGDWMPACAGRTFDWRRTYETDI